MSLSPPDLAYQEANIADDKRYQIIVANVICIVAAVIVVGLRFYARKCARVRLGIDDWLALAGLISYLGFIVCGALTTKYGTGRHAILVTDPYGLGTSFLAAECLYNSTLCLIKCSILCLYRRLFPQLWFQRTLWGLGVFVVAYSLGSTLGDVLQCQPLEAVWDPSIPATCINFWHLILGVGLCNIISDFVVLSLPMPILWRLRVSSARKRTLSVIFLVGTLTCVVSIVRLVYSQSFDSPDSTWDNVPLIIVSDVEAAAAMTAACIPTYGSILHRKTNELSYKAQLPAYSAQHTAAGRDIPLTNKSSVRRDPYAALSEDNNAIDEDMEILYPNGRAYARATA